MVGLTVAVAVSVVWSRGNIFIIRATVTVTELILVRVVIAPIIFIYGDG